MIKAIIFDLDGVIVDSEPLHFEAHQKALKEFGMEISLKEYLAFGVATGDGFLYEKISEKYPEKILSVADIRRRKKYIYKELSKDKLQLREGVADLLDKLSGNFVLTLASSGEKEIVEFVLDKFGLQNYFEIVISGNDVEKVKPNPDIYLKNVEKLGLDKKECIAIEDSQTGLRAAKAAGLKCIVVPCEFTQTQNFSEADVVFEKLTEINIEKINTL
jgi:putative hydrolase of the HAD superfamily